MWVGEANKQLLLTLEKANKVVLDEQLRNHHTTFFSFLPWEKTTFLTSYFDIHRRHDIVESYTIKGKPKRHLMDAFSSSLLHVSRIYNKAFGYMARKVPAHMPHMVDRQVIEEMQDKFSNYFDATSSHKIRHPEDMQFAFSFNYYLIGMKMKVNLSEVFDKVDSDNTGQLCVRVRSCVGVGADVCGWVGGCVCGWVCLWVGCLCLCLCLCLWVWVWVWVWVFLFLVLFLFVGGCVCGWV